MNEDQLNPLALRKAKTLWSFGLSECKRGKNVWYKYSIYTPHHILCPIVSSPCQPHRRLYFTEGIRWSLCTNDSMVCIPLRRSSALCTCTANIHAYTNYISIVKINTDTSKQHLMSKYNKEKLGKFALYLVLMSPFNFKNKSNLFV